jgi:hypothetical protein
MREDETDNHLENEPTMQILDRDDRRVMIGIKVEISWLPAGFLRQLLRTKGPL